MQPLSKKKNNKKIKKLDKLRNLFKFVSVLLSASVEKVGFSRMRDFLKPCLIVVCFFTAPILTSLKELQNFLLFYFKSEKY